MLHYSRRPISALLRANLITAGLKTLPLCPASPAATLYRRTLTHLPIRPTTVIKSYRFRSPRPLMFSTSANWQREMVEKAKRFALLKSKLEKEGIDSLNLKPGKQQRLLCPKCGGGSSKERSCSLFVCGDGQFAKWHCFRAKCGWKGLLEAFGECKSSHGATKIPKPEGHRAITEEELQLQPLSMKCGGNLKERSCSLFVRGDGQFAKWHCFKAKYGWKGLLEAFGECKSSYGATKIPKPEGPRAITEEELQPLSANCQREAVEKDEGFALLKSKLEKEGIDSLNLKPGKENILLCPKCGGGSSKERSCSLFVHGYGQFAKWHCFRVKCGWNGLLEAFGECKSSHAATKIPKPVGPRAITEEELQLQPLSMKLLQYFSVRGISSETLRRNDVRQRLLYNQVYIAFIYRRNGSPVSCKYRGIDKKFLQEPGTERIFYGLDDIKHARDIIIVEGEIDKLAMDEAGYTNCVSVPDGAPSKVSKEVPDEEKDTKFKFLWNCRQYLDKASRIILATDADLPGQALAEEIARRVGKERCWSVSWPKYCKDANEVLMFLGRDALKEVIENAEQYPIWKDVSQHRGVLKI